MRIPTLTPTPMPNHTPYLVQIQTRHTHTRAPHLDGLFGFEEQVGADGAVPLERLLLALVFVEQLQTHAGVARHAMKRVHAWALALRGEEHVSGGVGG